MCRLQVYLLRDACCHKSAHLLTHRLFTEEGTENKLEILPKLSVMIFDNQECSYFFARLSSCWTWSAERELCRTDS